MAPRLNRRVAGPDKSALAEDRTELAEDRTILAHERSFAGWLRTGMAAVGIGLGFNALFGALQPPWAAKALATVFLLIAILVFVSALRRAVAITARLEPHAIRALRPMNMRVLTWLLAGATAALIAAVWLLA